MDSALAPGRILSGRILVVDDQSINRELAQRRLERAGHHVTLAADGANALALVAARDFDLVLLDVMMPGLDGREVLAEIRAMHDPVRLPVIMVTARDSTEDVVQALELGANDYVMKPIDFPVLLARMDTQLARRQAEEALRDLNRELESRVAERTEEIERAHDALRESEGRFRALYDSNPAMFFTLTGSGAIASVNRFGAEQMGYTVKDLVGEPATRLCADDATALQEQLEACLSSPDIVRRWRQQKVRKNGSKLWVRETARVVSNARGEREILLVCEDITESHLLSQKLSYQASHDALTGLVNRHEFEIRLDRALESGRQRVEGSVLCYLDLDQFKVVNDTCGHGAGDELLRQLGRLLRGAVRRSDTLARLGGDEFAVLMEGCDLDQAMRVGEQIRSSVEAFRFGWEDKSFGVAVSMGLVPITELSGTVAEVMSAADAACYAAKDEGRNRIYVHREADREQRHQEMEWVAKIQQGLDENRFELYFQAIVPFKQRHRSEGHHYEVLLRLREGEDRIIGPGAFLPAAERYGLSPRIDRWVVSTVLRRLADHPGHLAELHLCSINLSGHSLGAPGFLDHVRSELVGYGIPPHKVCFEITETAAITNLFYATQMMNELKALGCLFGLDDFGSGLSSFGYLRSLPVDFLKIDGLFVKNILTDGVDRSMVRAINEIGQVMGKLTIAEFVESKEVIDVLETIGVDYGQGYGIGRPAPLNDLLGGSA